MRRRRRLKPRRKSVRKQPRHKRKRQRGSGRQLTLEDIKAMQASTFIPGSKLGLQFLGFDLPDVSPF